MRETVVKAEEFKDSPLGKIPTDWDVVSIDEIAIYVGSGITPRGGSNVYKKEGILFIRSQNVTFNGLRLDDVAYIDNRTHESMKRSEVFAHDVLLNITGASIGRCCPVPPRLDAANVNQHVCAIRLPNPNREDAIFLSSVLASYIGQSQIDRLNAGGNREGLNYQQLRAFVIPFPPPDERAGIAKILETVDETIAHTTTLIAKLKQMKAGLLHDLLTWGLDENGELRDAIGHPEQFKDSPLGQIPKDWEATTIGEQASTSSGSTPNRSNPKYWQDGTIAWVKTGEVNYTFIQDTEEKITQKALNETSLTVYPVDTVLMAMYGQGVTRGKVGILGIESTTNQACAAIIPKDNKLVSRYLFHYLSYYYDEIRSMSHGSNQSNLNERLIASFPIHLPPIKEQIRIVEMIDSHDTRIHAEEAYRDKLKLQKKGLMHDLLTGKVRVKDADKFTPASDTV